MLQACRACWEGCVQLNFKRPGVIGETVKLQNVFLSGLNRWLSFVLKIKLLEESFLI